MVQFFQNYTIEATLVFLFMLGTALKQGFELVQYFRNKAVDQVDRVRDREQEFTHALEQIAKQNSQLMK